MKKGIVVLVLLVLGSLASAQEASLTVPITRLAESRYVLDNLKLNFVENTAVVTLGVKDSGGVETRHFDVEVPNSSFPTATFSGLLSAIGTTRVGETGSAERRGNFRVIGYLVDRGYLTGVTLVP